MITVKSDSFNLKRHYDYWLVGVSKLKKVFDLLLQGIHNHYNEF